MQLPEIECPHCAWPSKPGTPMVVKLVTHTDYEAVCPKCRYTEVYDIDTLLYMIEAEWRR